MAKIGRGINKFGRATWGDSPNDTYIGYVTRVHRDKKETDNLLRKARWKTKQRKSREYLATMFVFALYRGQTDTGERCEMRGGERLVANRKLRAEFIAALDAKTPNARLFEWRHVQ